MNILTLLSNNWSQDPAMLHVMLSHHKDRRHEVIHRQLFCTGNITGTRLRNVFGELFKCHTVIFEQVSTVPPRAGGANAGLSDFNVEHVKGLIGRYRPDVILAVGYAPKKAMDNMTKAKRGKASEIPPVVHCIQPSTTRPGWLSSMTTSRDELEKALALAGQGVTA